MHINTGSEISFQGGGNFNTIDDSHPKFREIVKLCDKKQYEEAAKLLSVRAAVEEFVADSDVQIVGSKVMYGDTEVPSLLGRRIIDLQAQGLSVDSLVAFLENLMENTSLRAVQELYGFLESSRLPITEDGHFLAYKSVREDYKDHYSGSIDNSVGQVVEMPRNKVNEDKDQTCSTGLHFAAHEYAQGFRGGRMVVLKINPRDVVSIPSDYNNQKGRCCRYEVVEEVDRGDTKLVDARVVDTGSMEVEVEQETYVPQVDNYDDPAIWEKSQWGEFSSFQGKAKDFPVNRGTSYELSRRSTNKVYSNFFFVNYQEEHDNLVFKKFNGTAFDFITVSDVTDWTIEVWDDDIVVGS